MFGVGEDADIGQADCVGHGSHGGFVLRTEAGGRRTSRRGQAREGRFLIRKGRRGGALASSGVVQAFRRTRGGTGGAKNV